MNALRRGTIVFGAVVGFGLLTGGGAGAEDQHQHGATTAQHGAANASAGSKELHGHMMKSAAEMRGMSMTGDVDHDFVAMMKKHHQHGIEMARVVLQHGKDPKAKEIAREVIDEQQKDIAELDQWLSQHSPQKGASKENRKPTHSVR